MTVGIKLAFFFPFVVILKFFGKSKFLSGQTEKSLSFLSFMEKERKLTKKKEYESSKNEQEYTQ